MADEAARLIRYRHLPELVGSRLVVQSQESMAGDVLSAFGQFIDETQLNPEVFNAWPAYARYGCTHFALPARGTMLQGARSGMEVLVELGFVDPDDPPPALVMLDGPQFLESLRQDQPRFLLFLEDEAPIKIANAKIKMFPIEHQPRFPVSFRVTDACVGNTDWLWSNRHYYW
jgi:hypothetical protein